MLALKVLIDIPDEFLAHWNRDRFADSLQRLEADANLLAGNYEKELAEMLIQAFKMGVEKPDFEEIYMKHYKQGRCDERAAMMDGLIQSFSP